MNGTVRMENGMDEYIKKRAAIDALNGLDVSDGVGISSVACDLQEEAIRSIENLPFEDVAPVRHGRWIPKFDGKFQGGAYWFDCSECGHTVTGGNLSGKHFCENCGARMDGDTND